MQFKKNQPLWTALILHAVVLLGLFLATIVETFRPKEKPHVFVMVDPPGERMDEQPPSEINEPMLDLPEIPPMQRIPDPVVPRPAPAPTPTPTPTPTPQPAPTPKIVHIDDVRDQITQRNPRPQAPQPQPTPVPRVEINTARIRENLQGMITNEAELQRVAQMSQAQQDALQRYAAQLNARLNRAWIKPANLSGVRLSAQAEFDVSASGRISNVRLRPPSRNAAFDQSVLEAFSKVISPGPTPTGQGHTFTIQFRMIE